VAGDLRPALLLGGIVLLIVGVAEVWARYGGGRPEWTRKLVHTAGGLVCLLFPFLIRSAWTVLLMALGLAALFVWGARTGALPSLHRVSRPSRGAEYYPLTICALFVLSRGRPWLYVSSVLVLAVADAAAALVGGRYGRLRFRVEDEDKSVEGSAVFLLVAFLAIHLPVLLMTDLPRPNVVLSALLVAAVVAGFEIVSLQGTDNLFVPIAVCLILDRLTTKPLAEVVFQNVSLLFVAAIVGLLVWRGRLSSAGGAVGLVLFAYGAWSLGSIRWGVPVLLSFLLYWAAWVRWPRTDRGPFRVRVLFRTVLIPLALLGLANGLGLYETLYGPYLAAAAVVTACSVWSRIEPVVPRAGVPRVLAAVAVGGLAWAAAVLPMAAFLAGDPMPRALVVLLPCLAGAAVVDAASRRGSFAFDDPVSWPRLTVTLLAAAWVALAQQQGLCPPWMPA
jgi:phytol kinase